MTAFRALTLQSGTFNQIQDANSIVVGSGIETAAGDLTLTPFGTNVTIAAGKTLLGAAGAGAVDFSLMTGTFQTPTGAATFNGVTNTFTNPVYANGGVDRSAAAALSLGVTNANAVNIGKVGSLTTILGDFQVNGIETIVGNSTFNSDATFEGNVQFGNAVTDTVAFQSRIGPVTFPDFHFVKALNHTIDIDASTAVTTVGGTLSILGGQGGVASGVTPGGDGGGAALRGGNGGAAAAGTGAGGTGGGIGIDGSVGGAGSATGIAGAGGNVSIVGGAAGANGGAGGASGGLVSIRGGAATGAGVNGAIQIGTLNTSQVTIGSIANLLATAIQGNIELGAGGGTIIVQTGAVLSTTGTGNINLPNAAAHRFQIEGTSVGATVTAPNLDTLTNASNADALHFHTTGGASFVSVSGTAGETIAVSAPVVFDNAAGTAKVFNADANGAGELVNVVGFNVTAAVLNGAVTVKVAGEITVPDAIWDVVPVAADVGKKVFLSETAGKVTLTAPIVLLSTVIKVGTVSQFGSGTSKIIIQIGDGVVL